MKSIKTVLLGFLFCSSISYSQEKIFPQPQIEFAPENYICYRTDRPVKIDGLLNEKSWQNSDWTSYFVDIEGNLKPLPRFKSRVKMLWDEKYFYVAAEFEEPSLWATLHQRDTIIYNDNDFEIFIDPEGGTHKYYELEINALKTAWDLLLIKPYRDSEGKQVAVNSWNISGLKVGIHLNGTLNNPKDIDKGWTCEIAIPWSSLRESFSNKSAPNAGEQWRVNFSRVEWKLKNVNGKYQKMIDPATNKPIPEDNWVWSPTGLINIHYPEMWGYVQFSSKTSGEEKENFKMNPAEFAKWALRKIYYNEKTFFLNHQKYSSDISQLDLQNLKIDGYNWPPEIEITKNLFEARLISNDGKEIITIKNDGEVTVKK
jgi:hypothetical protein